MITSKTPKTIRTGKAGKIELRLVARGDRIFGLADGKIVAEGEKEDEVWRELHDSCDRASSRYFGYDGARRKFGQYFPGGFQSESYAGHERDYKVKAKRKLDELAPLERALEADALGESVLSVYRATNLLSPFEQTRMQAVLRSERADPFIRAAARFTLEPTRGSLKDMEILLQADGNAKWTVVTYLPFLWRPNEHMFLKPTVTVDFAERVGNRFAHEYEPRLNLNVYESLLNLAAKTEVELADLQPRDRIDVQSFIWVIGGSYDDEAAK